MPQISPLEALEARRDDLFAMLCRGEGDQADWAELERMTSALQAELLGDHLYPPVEIDHEALEEWYESQTDVPY